MQLQLFDIPVQKQSFSPFRLMGKVRIDEIFCYIGKSICCLVCTVGLLVIISGEVREAQRDDKIEELLYRKHEDEELLDEATPNLNDFDRSLISENQRKQIVRWQMLRKLRTNRRFSNHVQTELR